MPPGPALGTPTPGKPLTKRAVGRIFAYRPGRKGGGLYAIRFEKGSTLLSTKRVGRVAKGTGS